MLEKTRKLNIYLIYCYTFLSTFILFYSCDTLFFLERGISSSGYIIFVTITFLVQILLEIPAGVIADKYSRKKILLLSNLLFVMSTLIFIFSDNYYFFVLATVIKGIDNALVTGVSNSMLYDLIENKNNFNKVLFNKNFFFNISYMLAMILGGYIGEKYGLVNAYYLTLIPSCINFFVILSINGTVRDQTNQNYLNRDILINAINEIRDNKLYNIVFTNSIVFSIIKLVEESHPQYSTEIGISVFSVGLYTSLILVSCIIGNYIGSRINSKYYKSIIYKNSFFIGLCILIMGFLNNKLGILFLLIIYIFSESYDNIAITTLHSKVSSKSRVTVESILSMTLSLFGIIFSVGMSIILNYFEVHQAYIILGIIIILYSVVNSLVSNIKNNTKKLRFCKHN